MKIMKTIEFEPKDYQLIDALQQDKDVDLTDQPQEMVDLIRILSLMFENVHEITLNMELLSEKLKQIPPEIAQHYFSEFLTKYDSSLNAKQCPFCGRYYDEGLIVGGYMVCPKCKHKLLDDPSYRSDTI